MKILGRNTNPLCFLPSGDLCCYKHGSLEIIDKEGCKGKYIIFNSICEKILGRNNKISRLLRLGIRTAFPIDNDSILLCKGNTLYEFDLTNQRLSKGFFLGNGIRPLSFTEINRIKSFDNSLYFGGYLMNREKNPVNIYKRISIDKWEVVYTFDKGSINHIHNIISDPFRDCVWIFTGDFEDSAAIWKATDNFQNVECVLYGNQKYRGCVCFPVPEGLLYATDAPYAKNYIYLLKADYCIEQIYELPGSCIFGCQCGNKFVFSTTVEGDGRNESILESLFSRKLGAGIMDDYSHIVCGNLSMGFKEIFKLKKDIYPFSFQFAYFKFPSGLNESSELVFQPVATTKFDLSCLRMSV